MLNEEEAEYLIKAIEDKKNENILHLSRQKIENIKMRLFKKLKMTKSQINDFKKKLENYMYVSSVDEIKTGSFVRWFNEDDTEYKLTRGSILVSVDIGKETTNIVIKNIMGGYYTLDFDKIILFRKMTEQELMITLAIDYVNKK